MDVVQALRVRDCQGRGLDLATLPDAAVQALAGVADASQDFVLAVHRLNRVADPQAALLAWLRVTRPGGRVVMLVPDADVISQKQNDTGWRFTSGAASPWSARCLSLVDLIHEVADQAAVQRLVVRDDATIELVLRRTEAPTIARAATASLIPPIGRARLQSCRRGLMLLDPADSDTARQLDLYGEHAEPDIALFQKLLSGGDVVIDAGAGLGAHTVPLARLVGPAGQVHAFEPQEHRWRQLVANTALNELDQVRCWHAALGALAGSIDVPRIGPPTAYRFGATVPLMTLDQLGLPRCRLIRADLQGMEPALLQGARATIVRCQPVLHLAAAHRDAVDALRQALAGLGYAAHWHVAPAVAPANFYARPVEFLRDVMVVAILAVPEGVALSGGRPVRSNDWRSDFAETSS